MAMQFNLSSKVCRVVVNVGAKPQQWLNATYLRSDLGMLVFLVSHNLGSEPFSEPTSITRLGMNPFAAGLVQRWCLSMQVLSQYWAISKLASLPVV